MKVLDTYAVRSEGVPAEVVISQKDEEFINTYELQHFKIKQATQVVLGFLKEKIIEAVNIKTLEMLDPREIENVRKRFSQKAHEIIKAEMSELSGQEEDMLVGRLLHEMLGLGELELLLADADLEEVVINSSREPVYVYHKRFGWLKTNVVVASEDQIQNYASIVGRRVGRQITTLSPLMDANLLTGNRVNATLFPISTKGNGITIRKFRAEPWTIVNFISPEINTLSSEVAALLWTAIQYEINVLIGGGTASGKTAFLNSILVFTPPNQRVVSIEDSVAGESEILFNDGSGVSKTTVAELVDSRIKQNKTVLPDGAEVAFNDDGTKIFSMSKQGKIELTEPSVFIRHAVKRKVLDVTLESGRRITITPDHSLFTLKDNSITQINGAALTRGTFIATPRRMDYEGKQLYFDLTQHLPKLGDLFLHGGAELRKFIAENKERLASVCNKGTLRYYRRNGVLPIKSLLKLKLDLPGELADRTVIRTARGGASLPLHFTADEDLTAFCGLWLADGCYDVNSTIVSVVDEESRACVRRIAERFGCHTRMHSDGISLLINSKALKTVLQKILGLTGNAYTKRVPDWIWKADKKTAAALVKGYFSGDGWVRKDEIVVRTSSINLLADVQTLLLRFGIQLRSKNRLLKDKTFEARISGGQNLSKFNSEIGLLPLYKKDALKTLALRPGNSGSDVVPLEKETYLTLKHALGEKFKQSKPYKSWKSWHGGFKHHHIGRRVPAEITAEASGDALLAQIQCLAVNDVAWDCVEEVKERDFEGYVYDFSVPLHESFVCNNVVAHNTRELNLPDFLHWTPMSTRQPNPEGKGGVEMIDLMVNSLRMRPDRIVVGEIRRQREAEVLFEAMHTGHSVYSTLHADETTQVKNRLTSPPIELPEEMLSALQLIVVQYRQRRTGIRRTYELAEFLPEEKGVGINIVYRWDAREDKTTKVGDFIRFTNELTLHTGLTGKEVEQEVSDKRAVLEYMLRQKIDDVQNVGRVVARYYRDKDFVLDAVAKNRPREEVL
ncbi:MAG: ATPase, T2SS/T4P/T4SS family [Candidatus Micrarchaeota archaeon]